tara:strand:- start:486 stop:1034 length:549 start_codon:yes stop_codon:yes gene_type:complete
MSLAPTEVVTNAMPMKTAPALAVIASTIGGPLGRGCVAIALVLVRRQILGSHRSNAFAAGKKPASIAMDTVAPLPIWVTAPVKAAFLRMIAPHFVTCVFPWVCVTVRGKRHWAPCVATMMSAKDIKPMTQACYQMTEIVSHPCAMKTPAPIAWVKGVLSRTCAGMKFMAAAAFMGPKIAAKK